MRTIFYMENEEPYSALRSWKSTVDASPLVDKCISNYKCINKEKYVTFFPAFAFGIGSGKCTIMFQAEFLLPSGLSCCQADCYHYLFDAAVKLYQLGYDWSTPDHGPVDKITGSIYGFSRNSLSGSLGSNNMTDLLQASFIQNGCYMLLCSSGHGRDNDFFLICQSHFCYLCQHKLARQTSNDNNASPFMDHRLIIESQSDDIAGIIFDGVLPEALKMWHASCINVYVISLFGRLMHQHHFDNSSHGDLRNYLCGYFNTTFGSKKGKTDIHGDFVHCWSRHA
ncbi:hypothetical protein OROMI_012295 [Orobanche minor]